MLPLDYRSRGRTTPHGQDIGQTLAAWTSQLGQTSKTRTLGSGWSGDLGRSLRATSPAGRLGDFSWTSSRGAKLDEEPWGLARQSVLPSRKFRLTRTILV